VKDETLRLVFECSHGFAINMNDTFYYACADSAEISVEELEDLEPVIDKFGHDAFTAYEALRRGHDPSIPRIANKETFKGAKTMIQGICNEATEFGEFYELRASMKLSPHKPEERKKMSKKNSKIGSFFSFFTHR